MNAGRELDALVAEKVMGWTDVQVDGWHYKGSPAGRHPASRFVNKIPRYSTAISAAWEVVEKLTDPATLQFRLGRYAFAWEAAFVRVEYPNTEYDGEAATPALAICLAGLKVVGHSA